MTKITKQAQPKPDVKAEESKKAAPALEDKQLDQVTGGTGALNNACATGQHIPTGTIKI
jgi:hypothetical protein